MIVIGGHRGMIEEGDSTVEIQDEIEWSHFSKTILSDSLKF